MIVQNLLYQHFVDYNISTNYKSIEVHDFIIIIFSLNVAFL